MKMKSNIIIIGSYSFSDIIELFVNDCLILIASASTATLLLRALALAVWSACAWTTFAALATWDAALAFSAFLALAIVFRHLE